MKRETNASSQKISIMGEIIVGRKALVWYKMNKDMLS